MAVPSGTHTLKWKYYKYSGSTAGSCWIDAIQWSGGVPASGGGADWEQITYTYDPSGRRIAKLTSPPGGRDVDGEVTKYVVACPELAERDGDHCIAEYDANDVLLRKYIHGPSIDEPICMIEAAGGYAGTYYYHFDALGSVVALSDADGDTVQVYEYDVYGQVAASDPNHPNRFLFTGREFDAETGLYYYRARYYNPTLGRFLQTDPIGYEGGMNLYCYCFNNPIIWTDPRGLDANERRDCLKEEEAVMNANVDLKLALRDEHDAKLALGQAREGLSQAELAVEVQEVHVKIALAGMIGTAAAAADLAARAAVACAAAAVVRIGFLIKKCVVASALAIAAAVVAGSSLALYIWELHLLHDVEGKVITYTRAVRIAENGVEAAKRNVGGAAKTVSEALDELAACRRGDKL